MVPRLGPLSVINTPPITGNRTAEAEKKLRVSNDQLRAIVRENDERKKKVAQGNETMRSKIHEQEQNIKVLCLSYY